MINLEPKITISIVSHGHAKDINNLLNDLAKYCDNLNLITVILTLNIPETIAPEWQNLPFTVKYINNKIPQGFSKNHNAAFSLVNTPYFCVMNPDVRLLTNPWPKLLANLADPSIGVVAPAVLDENGLIQDSARRFPTLLSLLRRNLLQQRHMEYNISDEQYIHPDWVAGMFMFFKTDVYRAINGFDGRYFLYVEDVDLCARLRKMNYKVLLDTTVKIIHPGRRESHRSWRYFRFHTASMLRYFIYHKLPMRSCLPPS